MGFFAKAAAEVEVLDSTPEKRLIEVEQDWRHAETEYSFACRAIAKHNSLHPDLRTELLDGVVFRLLSGAERDPIRQRLEAKANRCLARRNELLAERAEILKAIGMIR